MDKWVFLARTVTPSETWPKVGTIVCAIVDNPCRTHESGREIIRLLREGLAIDRMTLSEAQQLVPECWRGLIQ